MDFTSRYVFFVLVTNVCTSYPLTAVNDAIMLIKTINDDIIELRCKDYENNSVTLQYANPTVTTTMYKNRVVSTYNSNSTKISRNINYWNITPEVLKTLSNGIKKIKIQYKNNVYEKEFKKDKIGQILYESYITELNYLKHDKEYIFKENF